jgi:hypothetical protein
MSTMVLKMGILCARVCPLFSVRVCCFVCRLYVHFTHFFKDIGDYLYAFLYYIYLSQ